MLEDFLIKITGKPEWPNLRYFAKKIIKYFIFVPPTLLRAKIREINDYMPDDSGKTFLFIGGLHRSGTSPLYKLLKSHPQISGISHTIVPEDEGQHLQTVYKPDSAYGMLFAQRKESYLTEQSKIADPKNKIQLLKEWGRYFDFSKPVLIEKSPSNIVRTLLLQYYFPKSNFIIVMRHPLATALAVKKWTKEPLNKIIDHWVVAHKIFLNDMNRLNSAILVRYEDLSKNQDAILTKIYDTVDLQPVEQKIQFLDTNEGYFKKCSKLQHNEQLMIRDLQIKYDTFFSKFGYSLSQPYVFNPTDDFI